MVRANLNLAAVGLALLLGPFLTAATPVDFGVPQELYDSIIEKRDPPRALAGSSTENERKWQPAMDFDKDGCYNTPAIDRQGNVAKGLDHNYTSGSANCRDRSDLDNNNVYVRTRCNNGWCAYVYDYYFEKDVAVQHVIDAGGHRHDWEHIVVFVKDGKARLVSVSAHGDYKVRENGDSKLRWDGTHPKVVYHKDGGSTHCFRFATAADDNIENHYGRWFRGTLVNWQGLKNAGVREKMVNHDYGKAAPAIRDQSFTNQLNKARRDSKNKEKVPGFDSSRG